MKECGETLAIEKRKGNIARKPSNPKLNMDKFNYTLEMELM